MQAKVGICVAFHVSPVSLPHPSTPPPAALDSQLAAPVAMKFDTSDSQATPLGSLIVFVMATCSAWCDSPFFDCRHQPPPPPLRPRTHATNTAEIHSRNSVTQTLPHMPPPCSPSGSTLPREPAPFKFSQCFTVFPIAAGGMYIRNDIFRRARARALWQSTPTPPASAASLRSSTMRPTRGTNGERCGRARVDAQHLPFSLTRPLSVGTATA
jgi:hypothetical protein